MKQGVIRAIGFIFCLFTIMGCEEEKKDFGNDFEYAEAQIIKEFHFASLLEEGIIMDNGLRVIQSKEEVAKHYTSAHEMLDTIDFDKYSLILGAFVSARLAVDVSCEFIKEGINSYRTTVYVTRYGKFLAHEDNKYFIPFGIVVKKLHYLAQVNLSGDGANIPMPEVLPNIWKCKGFGNTGTEAITKIGKGDCADCYQLTLKEEGDFDLHLSENSMKGLFKVGNTNFTFTDIRYTTVTNEIEAESRFVEGLKNVKSYKISDKQELLLYYSDTEYLIFEK